MYKQKPIMETMADKLTEWINKELDRRGWSHRELARRSKLSHSAVSNILSGYQPPTWAFCAAIAPPLGKPELEVFRLAELLPEEPHGQDEPGLLHRYRQLSPQHQAAAMAMIAGLAGATPPPAQPAPGADIDTVCRLLARLDSGRLEMAAIFIRWLIDQPGAEPSIDDRWLAYFRRLSPDEVEMALNNLESLFGPGVSSPEPGVDNHPRPTPGPTKADQGTLF